MKNLTVMVAADHISPIRGFLESLERQGNEVIGVCTLARVLEMLRDMVYSPPDVLLLFTGRNFQPALDVCCEVVSLRYSRDYSPRPQMLAIGLTERLLYARPFFEAVG